MDDEGILIQNKVVRPYLYQQKSLHALLSDIPSSAQYLQKITMSSIDTKIPRRMDRAQAFPQNVDRMFHPKLNQQNHNQNAEKQKRQLDLVCLIKQVFCSVIRGVKQTKGRQSQCIARSA